MAQWLRALTAPPEILSSIPSNHMVACNHLLWDLMPSSGVSEENYSVLTYNILKKHTHSLLGEVSLTLFPDMHLI